MDDLKKLQKQIASLLVSGKSEPDFFEVIRRFEQLHPECPRVGYARRSRSDVLHFSQVPSLSFPETALDSLQEGANGRLHLLVNFFGLCGVHGPLPLEYTSMVFRRKHHHYDRTMQRFLDIINHPFIRLYYRAYADNTPAICCDRLEDNQHELIFKVLLAQADGIAGSLKQKYAWLSAAQYLINAKRSLSSLYGILADFLHLPVHIEERVTESCAIPRHYYCRLGEKNNAVLGHNAQIGRSFLSNTRKIRIHFGPLNFQEYLRLLPGTGFFYRSASTVARFLDRPLDFDYVFRLRAETLPRAGLNGTVALGQSAWLGHPAGREIPVRIEAGRIFTELYQKKQQETGIWERR